MIFYYYDHLINLAPFQFHSLSTGKMHCRYVLVLSNKTNLRRSVYITIASAITSVICKYRSLGQNWNGNQNGYARYELRAIEIQYKSMFTVYIGFMTIELQIY